MSARPPRPTGRTVPPGILTTGTAFFLSLGLGFVVVERLGVVRLSGSALAASAVVGTILVGAVVYVLLLTSHRPPPPEPPGLAGLAASSVDAVARKAAALIADVENDPATAKKARERIHGLAEEHIGSLKTEQDVTVRAWERFRAELAARERTALRTQWMFFGLGVLASVPVGIAINLLTG
ncbi:hypothetical protein [Phytomonospora endophytica]|uniref:Uncharacterized protein n=1 Tax=Phytomonospora endophytica TaxID=714109 RepID=A0A841FHW1_9ACTN|nr:hypothetical protein [Phytomonospora endophytica]MBB6036931.1 hypothetical protein [Phytomonospora endophytica]GIG68038.1 hypothetical protein Pen01_43330 [Phytomonospora endophytica]